MNPNDNNFIPDEHNPLGFAIVEKARVEEVRFTERVQSFEECFTSGSAGAINFLRGAAADLFRTIPIVERHAVDELREAFESPFKHTRPPLCQYVCTLQVLRRALKASVALQTQPAR